MMAASASQAPAETRRLIDLCPHCGYSLTGLPDEGRCPECGRAYDQRALILHGTALGDHANMGNASPRRLVWILLAATFPLMHFGCLASTDAAWGGAALTVVVLMAANHLLVLLKRWNNPRPGLVQVCLSPWGCLQIDDVGKQDDHVWAWLESVLFVAWCAAAAVWGTVLLGRQIGGWRAVLAVTTVLAFLAPALYFRWRFVRQAARKECSPSAEQQIRAQGHPWIVVSGINIAPVDDTRTELRIDLKNGQAVHADLQCDLATRSKLDRLIRAWTIAAVAEGNARPTGTAQ
jgi:hypothetical protein